MWSSEALATENYIELLKKIVSIFLHWFAYGAVVANFPLGVENQEKKWFVPLEMAENSFFSISEPRIID